MKKITYLQIIRLISYLILIILILVNVAFVTLFERKILGYRQIRKGPNKVSFIGLMQPFNDAIKLRKTSPKEYIEESILNALKTAHEISTTTMKSRMEELTGGLKFNLPGIENQVE